MLVEFILITWRPVVRYLHHAELPWDMHSLACYFVAASLVVVRNSKHFPCGAATHRQKRITKLSTHPVLKERRRGLVPLILMIFCAQFVLIFERTRLCFDLDLLM